MRLNDSYGNGPVADLDLMIDQSGVFQDEGAGPLATNAPHPALSTATCPPQAA